MVNLGLSTTFLSSLRKLEANVQRIALNTIDKFLDNPDSGGLNLEKIANGFYSIRVNRPYRIILHQMNPSFDYVFVWIDHHDDAYDWANKRSIEVRDDLVQIVHTSVLDMVQPSEGGMYSHVSDADLEALNIPSVFFSSIRSIQNEDELKKNKDFFHPYIFESLVYLAEPSISVSEIIAMQKENTTSAGDLGAVAESSTHMDRQTIVQLRDASDLRLLEKHLSSPLSDWKLFLHPAQRRLAEGEFKGPVKVLGGAGTGKTVVLVHRAKYLAKKAPKKDILITTFTRNLTNDIADQVESICEPDDLKCIEIKNIDSLILTLFNQYYSGWRIIYDGGELAQLWEESMEAAHVEGDYPVPFLREEWSRIIVPQNIQDVREYFNADRRGRGLRLSRKSKHELWRVFSQFKSLLIERKISDINYALRATIEAVQADSDPPLYSSILVDEMQDFDELRLSFLRILAGEEHQNDMFLVGDSRQQIYRKEIVLKKCGINVPRQRSFRLNLNYRTTEEIRAWAYKLFDDSSVDDLDGETYDENRYMSLISGPQPTVTHFSSEEKEIEGIFDYIADLREKNEATESFDNICLTFRRSAYLKKYKSAFEELGFRCYEVKRDSRNDGSFSGIRFATLHRTKGLEFDHIIICAVNDGIIPNDSVISKATDLVMKRELEDSERNLLYVAATRARKTLAVFSHGKQSRLLR